MDQFSFMQSCRRINYHDDIVLRTPTISFGERLLDVFMKDQSFDGNSILEVKYPKCEKDIQDIMEELRMNADRNILAIHTERRLNDLISVQRTLSNTASIQRTNIHSWHTRTVKNCNLIELPLSVTDLLVTGDNRVFNFLEAMNPKKLKEEKEACLPSAFSFWTIPKFRKLLDEKINVLVFGGTLLKETDDNEASEQGFVCLLSTLVKLIRHIPFMCHFSQDYSKEDLVDHNLEKVCKMPQTQRNQFLIEEFKNLMSEIKCPDEYLLELFINDIMRKDYVIEKVTYRKRRNVLLIYRGLLFLLERRFEIFLNITIFRETFQMIRNFNPSEAMVVCLIRAGMVFSVVKIWRTFIEERDLRGNIATSMEEAEQRFSEKRKVTKRIIVEPTAAKTQSIKARKPLVAIIKTANGESKEFKISFKSRTNKKMNYDDLLCEHTQSAEVTTINPTAISSSSQPNTLLDESRKQDQSPDSQETVTDEMLSSENNVTRISKNLHSDDLNASEGLFEVQDFLDSGHDLDLSESEDPSSDSEYTNSPINLKINPKTAQLRKRSGSFLDSDGIDSSEENLVRPDKHDLTSKFISEANIPENESTTIDRKFSGNNPAVLTKLNQCDHILASDTSNSNIHINTTTTNRAYMPVNVGDGTGRTTRNLRPRQHMDKISKFMYLWKLRWK